MVDGAVTVTVATAGTVIVMLLLTPSLVAVMVVAPDATAVTSPLADTVAVAGALLVQTMMRPESTFPSTSLSTAAACVVTVGWRVVDGADTTTLVTGGGMTVTITLPVLPSLVAVMVTVPSPVL